MNNNNERFTISNDMPERAMQPPVKSRMARVLGGVALPGGIIDSSDVPFSGTPVPQPGEVANHGVWHEPIILGGIGEFKGNPERAIGHPANIAKADREFTAMTGIVVRRDSEAHE